MISTGLNEHPSAGERVAGTVPSPSTARRRDPTLRHGVRRLVPHSGATPPVIRAATSGTQRHPVPQSTVKIA
jgi:hypothetical protein